MNDHRVSERIKIDHQLSFNYASNFGRGNIVDWPLHGVKVELSTKLEQPYDYLIRFHVEKFKGLTVYPDYLSREGHICWVDALENSTKVGIYFPLELTAIFTEGLKNYITTDDFCHIYIYHKSDLEKNNNLYSFSNNFK